MSGIKIGAVTVVRASLTLIVIATAVWFAVNDEFYADAITSVFFSVALATAVILHLRVRPLLTDIALVLAVGLLLSAIDFGILRFPFRAMAVFSFLGLGSLVILGVEAIWSEGEDRQLLRYAFGSAMLFLSSEWMATTLLGWTQAAHPKTLDLYLYSFDCSLGFQPSFQMGVQFVRSAVLRNIGMLFYIGLPVPLALVYAEQLTRKREKALPVMLAFLITGPLGVVFYNLFPAAGPHNVFADNFPFHPLSIANAKRLLLEPIPVLGPRNAMPSLHMAWCLLAWWYARDLSWLSRVIAFAFLFFTVLSTLGSGEHWMIDLIVAFPFALMVEAICSFGLRWSERPRMAAFLFGALGTLAWMGLLIYGNRVFWTSRIVPWALTAATILAASILQSRLWKEDAAGIGLAEAIAHGIPEAAEEVSVVEN